MPILDQYGNAIPPEGIEERSTLAQPDPAFSEIFVGVGAAACGLRWIIGRRMRLLDAAPAVTVDDDNADGGAR